MYNNPLITIPRLQHAGNDSWEHHRGMGIGGDWHDDYIVKESNYSQAGKSRYGTYDSFGESGDAGKSWIPSTGATDLGEDSYQTYKGSTHGKAHNLGRGASGIHSNSAPDTNTNLGGIDLSGATGTDADYEQWVHPKDQKYTSSGATLGATSAGSGLTQDQGNNINVPDVPSADSVDTTSQFHGSESDYTTGKGAKEERTKPDDIILPDDDRFTGKTSKIGPDVTTAATTDTSAFLDYSKMASFISDQYGSWDDARWQTEIDQYAGKTRSGRGTGLFTPGNSIDELPDQRGISMRSALFHGVLNDPLNVGQSASNYNLLEAIEQFELSGSKAISGDAERALAEFAERHLTEGVSSTQENFPFRDLDVRKEVVYTDLKNQGASDLFISKYLGIEITNDMRNTYDNMTVDTTTAAPGGMDTQVRAYTQNINNAIAALSTGGLDTSQTDDLISQLSQEVKVPDGYEVVRDETGQPSVKWIGNLTGKSKTVGEGDLIQTIAERDMTKGRLSATDEQALNNALQTREQGQVAIQNYIQGKLGLSIDKERANIVSAEFTQSLNLETDKLTLSRDQFESNESFTRASVTGMFEDKPTLSAQELMAKLTGQVQTGTTNEFTGEGEFITSPIMADTVEMRKLRAELIGMFEGQPTINREQFEAALYGRVGDNATFAREQWEAEEARKRNESLLAAGKVVMENFITTQEITDPVTGEVTTVETPAGTILDSLEKQRLVIDEKIATAQLNGLRNIQVPKFDKDGKVVEGEFELKSISVLEHDRLVLDQARLDHLMAMEAAAQTGKIMVQREKDGVLVATEEESIAGRKMSLEERQFKAQMDAMAGYITTYDAQGNAVGKMDTLESVSKKAELEKEIQDINLGVDAHERSGLEQMGGPTDSPEGVAYRLKQDKMRRAYMDSLNSALSTVTMEETEGLENALSMALPPSPAGMVWDSQGGVFRLRSGFEGRDIDPYTQRELEAVAPILRARDRAERVLLKLQEDKFDFEQAQRIADDQQIRLTNALNNGDISTAEEAAYRKSVAETTLIEQQAKNEKYTMLFQLLQNPVALGMARHYGVLQQIEADLGIQLPHVPQVEGDGSAIPNFSDWTSMSPDEQGLRMNLWTTVTGGSPQTFVQLVDQTRPADYNPVEYSTYAGG